MNPIVVIISANIEWKALIGLFPEIDKTSTPFGETFEIKLKTLEFSQPIPVRFVHGGWGKISAAASAQYIVDHYRPSILLNLGTCGGFEGRIERGTVLVIERTLVYDIYEQMGDNDEHIAHYTTNIDLTWLDNLKFPDGYQRGFLISGDRDLVAGEIPRLEKEFGAYAGDWESAAIAWVAKRNSIKTIILRGVSDLVGFKGGEAYGAISIFKDNTRTIINKLVMELPLWLGFALKKLKNQQSN